MNKNTKKILLVVDRTANLNLTGEAADVLSLIFSKAAEGGLKLFIPCYSDSKEPTNKLLAKALNQDNIPFDTAPIDLNGGEGEKRMNLFFGTRTIANGSWQEALESLARNDGFHIVGVTPDKKCPTAQAVQSTKGDNFVTGRYSKTNFKKKDTNEDTEVPF